MRKNYSFYLLMDNGIRGYIACAFDAQKTVETTLSEPKNRPQNTQSLSGLLRLTDVFAIE